MREYNEHELRERLHLPGINKSLDIYVSPEGNFYTDLTYDVIQFINGKKEIKFMNLCKRDRTIPGLLRKVQRGLSRGKNYHDRPERQKDWRALVFLTNQIQTHSNVGGMK